LNIIYFLVKLDNYNIGLFRVFKVFNNPFII